MAGIEQAIIEYPVSYKKYLCKIKWRALGRNEKKNGIRKSSSNPIWQSVNPNAPYAWKIMIY